MNKQREHELKHNDYELWDAYTKAQKEAETLYEEVKKRNLIHTPICQWSSKRKEKDHEPRIRERHNR